MSLRSMKKVTRQSRDMILITDTVVYQVNLLGKDQQYILLFTDSKGRIFGDGYVELTGVYGDRDENEAPLKIKN